MTRKVRAAGRIPGLVGAATASLLLAAASWTAASPPGAGLMPLGEVRPGQRGEVLTVLQGREPVRIPLEILEIAPGFAGPGIDVILARLEGAEAAHAGVVAGMSGSPVYVEGRLVGALSYRIGAFPKEALAGITPIESMLSLESGGTPAAPDAFPAGGGRYPAAALLGLVPWPEDDPAAGPAAATPLAVAGLPAVARQTFEPLLSRMGLGPWVPAAAAASGPAADGSGGGPSLQPGDPVAAVLVRGDITLAGTGTATLVEEDRVLALGHPLLQAGDIDLPMARAEVLVTVPSLLSSFKMTRVGEVVGAFRRDRTAGLAGRLGAEARMVPVAVSILARGEDAPRRLGFEIVRTPGLSPLLLEMSLAGSLLTHPMGGLGGTVTLEGRLLLEGVSPVSVSTGLTGGPGGPPAALLAARHAAGLYRVLAEAAGSGGRELSLDLSFRIDPDVRLRRLEEARLSRDRARPGDEIMIRALLRDPVSGDAENHEFTWTVPDLPAGTSLQIDVGDAPAMAAAAGQTALAALSQTGDPERLARVLSGLRTTRALYLRIGRSGEGLVLDGEPMPGLPPSVLGMLQRDGTSRPAARLESVAVHEASRALDAVVSGSAELTLEVE